MEMEGAAGGGGGGSGTLSEIYQNAKKVQLRTTAAVERLERLEYSSGGMESPELSFSIKRDISHIQSLCVEMGCLCRSLPSKSHRDLWKRYPSPYFTRSIYLSVFDFLAVC
jgi:Golgi SNAP receptor complex protein 2